MVKPKDALKDFLILLLKEQESAWVNRDYRNPRDEPSETAFNTYCAIINKWIPITLEEIESFFKENDTLNLDFSERGKVLYLPPLKKDANFVPILSLDCKWNQTWHSARLKVMLVCLDNGPDKNPKFYGIGFRLETPEGMNQPGTATGNEGIHDFHHAQLIKKFGKKKLDRKLEIDCPSWLPESQPSFPLPAKCPVSLLFCLIATLYGRKEYNDYRNKFPKLKHYPTYNVHKHLKKLDLWINQRLKKVESLEKQR